MTPISTDRTSELIILMLHKNNIKLPILLSVISLHWTTLYFKLPKTYGHTYVWRDCEFV